MNGRAAASLLLALVMLPAAPAPAEPMVPDRVDQLIVYDDADCPRDTADTVASCIVVTGESPYRIPTPLRAGRPDRQDVTAAQQALILLRPTSGYGSCSTSGAGSVYGCVGQAVTDWQAERAAGTGAYYAGLIAQARAKRLAEGGPDELITPIDTPAPD